MNENRTGFLTIGLVVSLMSIALVFSAITICNKTEKIRELNNRISNLEHFVNMGDFDSSPEPAKNLSERD